PPRARRAACGGGCGSCPPGGRARPPRLSVFAGGFTLEAAEAVCDASIDSLASLVDKSLVTQPDADDARFALLETVREYARERLEERGEAGALADAHADYFFSLAGRWDRHAPDANPDDTLFLYREVDNIRRAHGLLLSAGDLEGELRSSVAVFWSLWTRGNLRELHAWLASGLERSAEVDPWLRAEVLGAAALAAANSNERGLAREYAAQSLVL